MRGRESKMENRDGIFAGQCPFSLARTWLAEAEATELNDPNAIALSTVDASGLPNARIVLLKAIEDDAFVFYTNYTSAKGRELEQAKKAAFVMHWKSLGRQIRVRGHVTRQTDAVSDAYYQSRDLQSRLGAWASQQSQPLASRDVLIKSMEDLTAEYGDTPPRPPHWGGYRVVPVEVEFWADGASRLHDRFKWLKVSKTEPWDIQRLNP
jgi:pyridoxamine 5'-phosphate oxidase